MDQHEGKTAGDGESDRDRFVERFWRDIEKGQVSPLRDYLEDFPDIESFVAEEYLAWRNGEAKGRVRLSGIEEPEPIVGSYRILSELGRGGQAIVYKAIDTRLSHGRLVALRLLKPESLVTPNALLRFRREAEILSKLDHPSICPIYEVGFDRTPFIAMKLINGETLAARIASGLEASRSQSTEGRGFVDLSALASASPTGEESTGASPGPMEKPEPEETPRPGTGPAIRALITTIEQVARALHAAHEKGIVHRDIKPGNLMIQPDGQPVVLDFGLAQDSDASGPSISQSGDLFGTPAYLAPEQIAAKRMRVDGRADVFSLGVTLFECLSLERPFKAPTRDALYQAISFKDPPDIRQLNPAVTSDLKVVLDKALEKDPDRRFQTADDFAEELRRIRLFEPILTRPVSLLGRHLRWTRRNPGWAAALYGFVLMAAVAAGVFIWKNAELRGANRSLEVKTKEAQENAIRAEANAKESAENASRADANARNSAANAAAAAREREVQEKLAEVRRMADIKLAREFEAEADQLWPLGSALPYRIQAWLDRVRTLMDRLPLHEAALRAIEAQALPYSADDRSADHGPALARLESIRTEEDALEKELDDRQGGVRESTIENRLDELGAERDDLTRETSLRLTWRFPGEDSDYLSWKRRNFAELIETLGRFTKPETGHLARVDARMAASRLLIEKSLREAALLWESCRARMRSNARYSDLELPPQEGLIPLGADPDSGLEEFLHWATHDPRHPIPSRDGEGHLPPMDGETGVILVLLPGGRFLMGSQRSDEMAPNFDAGACSEEFPVHPVSLSPFLLGKHELTRGQWTRLAGSPDPTNIVDEDQEDRAAETSPGSHPVAFITYWDSERELSRGGLQIPTECQWEYGCRSGSEGPWSFGSDLKAFPSFANLKDESYRRANRTVGGSIEGGLVDGHAVTAPVGSFRANGYGLLDMHGNVWEWTRDEFFAYPKIEVDGNQAVVGKGDGPRVLRGGSCNSLGDGARSAFRFRRVSSFTYFDLGVRPSRPITP